MLGAARNRALRPALLLLLLLLPLLLLLLPLPLLLSVRVGFVRSRA